MTDKTQQTSATEASAIAEIARSEFRGHITTVETYDGIVTPFLFCPTGGGAVRIEPITPEAFDKWRDHPRHRAGTAEMTDLESFIAHVQRFKDEDSALFGCDNAENPSLLAVIDYHDAINSTDGDALDTEPDPKPEFGKHRTHYGFPFSDEWKAWNQVNGESLDIITFAEFLEDHIIDVMPLPDFLKPMPEDYVPGKLSDADQKLQEIVSKIGGRPCGPERLMELAKGIIVNAREDTTQKIDLSSGESKLKFESRNEDISGAPLSLPNLFLLAIPVFRGGDTYRIPVRLRYRARAGTVLWSLLLHRPDLYLDDALSDAFTTAATRTGLPLFRGKPE